MGFLQIILMLCLCTALIVSQENAFKRPMGDTIHDIAGDPVQLIDTRTLRLKNFRYDGKAPRAFFIVGKGDVPTKNVGFDPHPAPKIPNEKKSCDRLPEYKTVDIDLKLPSSYTQGWSEIKWIGVYCFLARSFFAYQLIPTAPADLKDGGPGEAGCDNPERDESDNQKNAGSRDGLQLAVMIIGMSLVAVRIALNLNYKMIYNYFY